MFRVLLIIVSLVVLPKFIGGIGAVVVALVIGISLMGARNASGMSGYDELLIGNAMVASRRGTANPATGQFMVNDIVDISGKFYGMR